MFSIRNHFSHPLGIFIFYCYSMFKVHVHINNLSIILSGFICLKQGEVLDDAQRQKREARALMKH